MSRMSDNACLYVAEALSAARDPEKAIGMQAYLKTDMPFYGVQKPGRIPILRHLEKEFVPRSRQEYEELVMALWDLPHREEKYLAQGVARHHEQFLTPESLPLFRRMIVEGAWWDLVDGVATHMIRHLVINHPAETWPTVDGWVDHEDMWLRRTSIICQVGAKDRTNARRLFRVCAARAFEKEFFIRKAIGWALRDYARTDPQSVASFVIARRDELSGLSWREATKHIGHLVEP